MARLTLSIDRFEGRDKEVAVLLADDGTPINFPRRLLPEGAKAGDVLALAIERDARATSRLASKTKQVQKELRKTDPGGDVTL